LYDSNLGCRAKFKYVESIGDVWVKYGWRFDSSVAIFSIFIDCWIGILLEISCNSEFEKGNTSSTSSLQSACKFEIEYLTKINKWS